MSSRAIAPVVGANHNTVARDLRSVSNDTDAPRTVKSLDGVDRTFKPRPEPEPVTAELESDLQIANDTPHVYGLDLFQTRTGSITALPAWAARDPLDRMGNFPNRRSTRVGSTEIQF